MGGVEILQTHLFFDLIDVALVNSHIVYTKLGNDISLLNFKIVEAKALLADTVIVRDCSTPVGQANKNLMNHQYLETPNPHGRFPEEANEIPLLQE